MSANTKKSGARFNIFDILILLAILASIAAIGVRVYFLASGEENVQTTRVEFVVKGVSEVTAQNFAKQYATLYLDSTDAEIGAIISATYTAASVEAENEEGKLVIASHPDKMDIHGYANISGTWSEDGFLVGGTELASVGKTVTVYTQDATCMITIVSIPKAQ